MRKLSLTILFALAAAAADTLPEHIRLELRDAWEANDPVAAAQVVNTTNLTAYIYERLASEQRSRAGVSFFRRDLHLGSLSVSSASTSVVAMPGATDLIAAAIESGAFTRKTEGSNVTIGVNALPIYQLAKFTAPSGCGSVDEDCRQGAGRWIRGLSGSLSLQPGSTVTPIQATGDSTNTPAPTGPVALLLGDRRISAISARYEFFVRERSASALEKALADTVKELQDAIKPFGPSQIELETRMDSLLGKGWRTSIVAAMKTNMGTVEAMERVLLEEFRRAYVILIAAPEFAPLYNAALEKRIAVIKAQNKLLAEKLYRKALTVDYVHQRPADQPFLHQGRLVLSTPLGTKPETPGSLESAVPGGNLTFNGGLTFYGSTKAPGVKKLRDAQASAALDWSPRGWGAVRPTYTAAYYFQYMIENGVIEFDREAVTPGGATIPLPKPAIEVLNTKGPIHVAQFRMSFPIGATGISFPLAFSYSSRTELITGRSFWQGHVGMTYDFSKLRTLLGAAAGGLLP